MGIKNEGQKFDQFQKEKPKGYVTAEEMKKKEDPYFNPNTQLKTDRVAELSGEEFEQDFEYLKTNLDVRITGNYVSLLEAKKKLERLSDTPQGGRWPKVDTKMDDLNNKIKEYKSSIETGISFARQLADKYGIESAKRELEFDHLYKVAQEQGENISDVIEDILWEAWSEELAKKGASIEDINPSGEK